MAEPNNLDGGNRVLNRAVNKFAERWDLAASNDADKFEAFVAYTLFRKLYRRLKHKLSDVERHLVAGGADGGIDAIGIFINNQRILTKDQVDRLAEGGGDMAVDFVFIQATTSAKFDASKISDSLDGVEEFFEVVNRGFSTFPFNDEVRDYIDLASHIILNHDEQVDGRLTCSFYFATKGRWEDQTHAKLALERGEQRLERLGLFAAVKAAAIGASQLRETYHGFDRTVERSIAVEHQMEFPGIYGSGVDAAYIALVPIKSFIDLVSTDDGDLNRDLFYDNVRDYQGDTKINREIATTLKNSRQAFPLYNNGITIVAQKLTKLPGRFRVHDFQIVNGCQTTNVLFQNKDQLHEQESTYVSVKLVATQNRDMITAIIRATNSQTAISEGLLDSFTTFYNHLESWYNAAEEHRPAQHRVYFERRSQQYRLDVARGDIKEHNIVSLPEQTAAFIGMFLGAPHHSDPDNFSEMHRLHESYLFNTDHMVAPYHASGVAAVAVDRWIRSQSDRDQRKQLQQYKHHLLMLLRVSIAGMEVPPLNNKRIDDYCEQIVALSRDDVRWPEVCGRAAESLETTRTKFAEYYGEDAPAYSDPDFSKMLLGRDPTGPAEGVALAKGAILWYQNASGYGRIMTAAGKELLVYASQLGQVPVHMRTEGTEVLFRVGPNPASSGQAEMIAMDVRVDSTATG